MAGLIQIWLQRYEKKSTPARECRFFFVQTGFLEPDRLIQPIVESQKRSHYVTIPNVTVACLLCCFFATKTSGFLFARRLIFLLFGLFELWISFVWGLEFESGEAGRWKENGESALRTEKTSLFAKDHHGTIFQSKSIRSPASGLLVKKGIDEIDHHLSRMARDCLGIISI